MPGATSAYWPVPTGFAFSRVQPSWLISRLYQAKSTIITTNRAFKEWHEVFPNAACVVSLIDRLVHRCEIVMLQGESYRLKEAMARSEQKGVERAARAARRPSAAKGKKS